MSGKSKHHEDHEEHIDETWLIPYADLLTLLLALFIVLFASSSLDKDKFESVMEVMYTAFGGNVPDGVSTGPLPTDIVFPLPDGDGDGMGPSGHMRDLYSTLTNYVSTNQLEGEVAVEFQGENLLVTLKNDIWFASGSAELTPEMQEKARVLARILSENQDENDPFEIIVAGHTDNVPINTVRFPSNLDLSLARAAEFHRFLLKESGLNPKYFSSRGYGEEMPIATNETPEGRALNRRVELLISQKIRDEFTSPYVQQPVPEPILKGH